MDRAKGRKKVGMVRTKLENKLVTGVKKPDFKGAKKKTIYNLELPSTQVASHHQDDISFLGSGLPT